MSELRSDIQFIVPDGYSPPFAIVTDTDHTAWIYIATALGLALILLFGGIRVIVRGSICPGVGLDDYFLAASTGFAVVQASVVLTATADGLGKSIELIPLELRAKIQQLYYADILLFVIALGLSKLSLISFLSRLTSYGTHKRIFSGVAALTLLWMLGSLLALALECQISQPWLVVGEQCTGTRLRWETICALDIAIEMCMVGMSVLLVWNLHAKLSKKMEVIATFAFRLLLIIPIAFRLANFDPTRRTSNFFLAEDLFVVWTQTELNYSIISATIPTLRIFATTLNTQFGGLTAVERADYSDSFKNSSQDRDRTRNSQDISTLAADTSGTRRESAMTAVSRFPSRQNRYSCNVSTLNRIGEPEDKHRFSLQRNKAKKETESDEEITPVGESSSTAGENSMEMTIRKEVAYDVEHGHN